MLIADHRTTPGQLSQGLEVLERFAFFIQNQYPETLSAATSCDNPLQLPKPKTHPH